MRQTQIIKKDIEKVGKAFKTLKEFLEENEKMPYYEARLPTQFIKSYGFDKKTPEELIKMVEGIMPELSELIKRAKVENPWETGLNWNTVAENAEMVANLLYIIHDKTPLPEMTEKEHEALRAKRKKMVAQN
tara:strand:- start:554 stop:949 length:396 start_codon:yes stop_codon:yes gene_type:complete